MVAILGKIAFAYGEIQDLITKELLPVKFQNGRTMVESHSGFLAACYNEDHSDEEVEAGNIVIIHEVDRDQWLLILFNNQWYVICLFT